MKKILMKYGWIKRFADIYGIKTGDIYQYNTQCYRAHKLFSGIYGVVMIGPIQLFWVFLFLYLPVKSIALGLLLTMAIYFIIEIVLIAFVPLVEVPCWEKRLQEKEKQEY